MDRRGFLKLVGVAVIAPSLPVAKAGVSDSDLNDMMSEMVKWMMSQREYSYWAVPMPPMPYIVKFKGNRICSRPVRNFFLEALE